MVYKDKEKEKNYRRQYYREYYHKNKPSSVKSSSIKNGTLLIQYYKVLNTKTDFMYWMLYMKIVIDEFKEKQKNIRKY